MNRITLSINSAISWVLKILMLVIAVYFLFSGSILMAGFAFLMLLISLTPASVDRSYDTNLPWSFDFLLTVWLAFAVLGEMSFYQKIWWWDDFLHFGGTAVLVYLAFVLVYALNFTKKIRLSIPMIGFFTFLVGMAFGGIWEIAEFYTWQITGKDALAMGTPPDFEVGLIDTFTDLQFDAVSSLAIALAGMKYVGQQRHVKLREWMRPFIKIFGGKIKQTSTRVGVKLKTKKISRRK